MGIMLGCDAYKSTPTDLPMRWDDHPVHNQKPINTSFPLMFLLNTADSVTPLFAGVKMARKFFDAGMIEQKSEGHCSLAAVSRCMMERVREYFEEWKVLEKPARGPDGEEIKKGMWRRCEADEWPWKPFDGKVWMVEFEPRLRKGTIRGDMVDVQVALEEEWTDLDKQEKALARFAANDPWKRSGFKQLKISERSEHEEDCEMVVDASRNQPCFMSGVMTRWMYWVSSTVGVEFSLSRNMSGKLSYHSNNFV